MSGFDADADASETAEADRLAAESRALRLVAALRDRMDDPAVAARLADEQTRRARAAAAELASRADVRGVPADANVRDWALAAKPDVAATHALRALRPLAERTARVQRDGKPRAGLVFLLGTPGQGKTVALARAVLHHPRSARYLVAGEVGPRTNHSESRAEWERLTAPDLLALDEAGQEGAPAAVVELLLARWTAGRFTVVASNLAPADFAARYTNPALLDRVSTQGFAAQVVLAGPSLRRAP